MNLTSKKAAATVGCLVLAASGMAATVPAAAQEPPSQTVAQTSASQSAHAGKAALASVAGTFAFDQEAVSSNRTISSVFGKAASVLCASLPRYALDGQGRAICVSSPGASFGTALEDLAESGTTNITVGCSCASNGTGGGAAINANVSGVPLALLASLSK